YILFRFYVYYITVKHYPRVFLEYMLLAEILFVAAIYFTLWLYRRFFLKRKYFFYFSVGAVSWIVYLYAKTAFQFYYLKNVAGFQGNRFSDTIINNLTVIVVYFLFITACKVFKDGYVAQQFEAERKKEQLMAEVNNLKSQIAPHFLFNTLNNLYGLAVDKSDKLPELMLQLSHLLRHSLYETQKALVPVNEEIDVLKAYIQLESVRLEDDLKLEFDNTFPKNAKHKIAPLILIVFTENAFKHSKLVQSEAVKIYIKTMLEKDWFTLTIKNNYNREKKSSANGIGLINVQRRLDLLYPDGLHQLEIRKDDFLFEVILKLKLKAD
ncbi:MAG: histidine kinase, partial [Bacteroidota bacterium]